MSTWFQTQKPNKICINPASNAYIQLPEALDKKLGGSRDGIRYEVT